MIDYFFTDIPDRLSEYMRSKGPFLGRGEKQDRSKGAKQFADMILTNLIL